MPKTWLTWYENPPLKKPRPRGASAPSWSKKREVPWVVENLGTLAGRNLAQISPDFYQKYGYNIDLHFSIKALDFLLSIFKVCQDHELY